MAEQGSSSRDAGKVRTLLSAAWLLCAVSAGAEATPVAPSQITPPSLAPELSNPTAPPRPPAPQPVAAPAGAERLTFHLRRVFVENGFEDLAAPTQALVKAIEGRKVTVARLYELAGTVERAYAATGYPLVRIVVPAQELRDGGDARLLVIDGFIESLALDGVPERIRPAIAARAGRLVGRRHLTSAELERATLIAGDVAGVKLRSALARGKAPGGTVLALEADWRLVSASVSTDNDLPRVLGGYAWNARLAVNGALGWGEQAYLSYTSGYALGEYGFPGSPLRTVGVGLAAPIGDDGLTLNPEYTNSQTRPNRQAGVVPSIGLLNRVSLRPSLPLLRSVEEDLTLTGALEGVDQRMFAPGFGADLSHDRYAALRLGAGWRGVTFWGAPFQANGQVSQGLAGRRPGAAETPLSRQGATPGFRKLGGDIRLDQPLPAQFQLALVGRAQWSFGRAQMTSEQFALEGTDAVSAFVQGAFSVDAGATLRAELNRPFAWAWGSVAASVSPYLFAAQGFGVLDSPTAQEKPSIRARAVGLGVRLLFNPAAGFESAGLDAELSRGTSNAPGLLSIYRALLTLSCHY